MNKNIEEFVEKIKKSDIPTLLDGKFSTLTTIGCGGKIKVVVFPDTVKKLVQVVKLAIKHNVQYFVLGNGSNVIASDNDFDGVVICTRRMCQIKVNKNVVEVSSGTKTADLCKVLMRYGLSGGEFMACLPATVGGATVCNAGCFGKCMADVVSSVTVLDNGKVRKINVKDCGFNKRTSTFKGSKVVVLSVCLVLEQSTSFAVAKKMLELKRQKRQLQPILQKSAGCVLYHETQSISQLIDQAGLKGYQIGGAKISEKHAGFVINIDKSTSKDIYLLVQYIYNKIKELYGVVAKLEVVFFNFDQNDNDFFSTSKN